MKSFNIKILNLYIEYEWYINKNVIFDSHCEYYDKYFWFEFYILGLWVSIEKYF